MEVVCRKLQPEWKCGGESVVRWKCELPHRITTSTFDDNFLIQLNTLCTRTFTLDLATPPMWVCLTAHLRAWLESAQNQLSGCAILMAWGGLGGSKLYSFSVVTQQPEWTIGDYVLGGSAPKTSCSRHHLLMAPYTCVHPAPDQRPNCG